jgi:tRNA nucleotidyltransferase (CCA-adding enzyme)
VRAAERISARLKVPVECRDVARLVARWNLVVERVRELRPARLLDLLLATDALRRPERLDALIAACAAIARSREPPGDDDGPARVLRGALAAVKRVNAGAIARRLGSAEIAGSGSRAGAIAAAVRAARLAALRDTLAQIR